MVVLTAWVTHLSPSPLPLKDTPTPSLPTPLLASFKKALGAKALAPPVRAGYLNCLVSLGGDGGAREFLGDLIKSVERAQAQPTQAPIVHEAISASILLLRLSRVVRDDPKLNAVLESTILNTKKQVLLSEKILAQASPEARFYSSFVFLVSHPAFQCDNKKRLALATLQPGCHEKIIAHVRARNAHELMLNVLRKLNIEDAKKFVLTHESTLVDTYIGGSTQANARGAASSAHNNVLRFLTRTNPAVIWTPIFEKLVDFFETTHLAISNDEYFTFLTPEGQIYDKTLLERYVEKITKSA
ncbi:uncharacterized protein LOC113465288 [Diaphorina citri]|uniref:Uncharacterized protein LOC113465288 n=1 Tax=Diaphorina citri TaxID=121845 RepID=A0A3Q0J2F8_DIACI|nr:uncharacterized protein LOC113465288 [Diaphorina citri]